MEEERGEVLKTECERLLDTQDKCLTSACVTFLPYLQSFKSELDVIRLFEVHVMHEKLASAQLHEHS